MRPINVSEAAVWIRRGAQRYVAKLGDQVIQLNRVESFFIGLNVTMNSDASGTLRVDKVRFYSEQ